MNPCLVSAIFGLGLLSAGADVIRITGTGKVLSSTGAALVELGVAKDQAVELEIRHSDEGEYKILSFFGFVTVGDFYERANLHLTVRIGGQEWKGFVRSASRLSLRVIELTDYVSQTGAGAVEKIRFLAQQENSAVFDRFPGSNGQGRDSMTCEFVDDATTYDMVDGMIFHPEETTRASGLISSGEAAIAFSVDPATLVKEALPSPPPIATLQIRTEGGNAVLAWPAKAGGLYEVRASENLRFWEVIDTVESREAKEIRLPVGGVLSPRARFFRVFEIR